MAQLAVRRVRIKACAARRAPRWRVRRGRGCRKGCGYTRAILDGIGFLQGREGASRGATQVPRPTRLAGGHRTAARGAPQDRGAWGQPGGRARRRTAWIARRGEKIGKTWRREAGLERRVPHGASPRRAGRTCGREDARQGRSARRARTRRAGAAEAARHANGCAGAGAHARRLVRHTPRPRERALYAIRRRPPQDRAARAALRLRAIPAAPAATAAGAPTYMPATSRIAAMPCATTEASEAGSACVATWSE